MFWNGFMQKLEKKWWEPVFEKFHDFFTIWTQQAFQDKIKGTDIIQDPEFAEVNKVFLARCVDLKRQSLAKVEHKPAILKNLLFKRCIIKQLLNSVFAWYHIMHYQNLVSVLSAEAEADNTDTRFW